MLSGRSEDEREGREKKRLFHREPLATGFKQHRGTSLKWGCAFMDSLQRPLHTHCLALEPRKLP